MTLWLTVAGIALAVCALEVVVFLLLPDNTEEDE